MFGDMLLNLSLLTPAAHLEDYSYFYDAMRVTLGRVAARHGLSKHIR